MNETWPKHWRRKFGKRVAVAHLALLLGIPGLRAASADAAHEVRIKTATGEHVFSVEIARTEKEREHGLMDRKSMARNHGMLFDFGSDQPVVFWMKDTYIPLDMIFVSHDGRVVDIKHDAKPMDETLIPSRKPAQVVIELNAGLAAKMDVRIDDRVENPVFKTRH